MKIRYDPSGAIVGSRSSHSPENGAIRGFDHVPPDRCETRIVDWFELDRVKNTVLPSGVKAGDRSFAGPEITPGENIRGAVACAATAVLNSVSSIGSSALVIGRGVMFARGTGLRCACVTPDDRFRSQRCPVVSHANPPPRNRFTFAASGRF